MWLTALLGVVGMLLAGICVGQWLRLRQLADDLAASQRWTETWYDQATEESSKAHEALSALSDLRCEHAVLKRRHEQLQQLHAERTQVALWAGVVRFLMN